MDRKKTYNINDLDSLQSIIGMIREVTLARGNREVFSGGREM
jgi:hypothetical protein